MSDNKKTPLPLEIMALELFATVLMGIGVAKKFEGVLIFCPPLLGLTNQAG